MPEVNEQIQDMVNRLSFERRQPVSAVVKTEYERLRTEISEALQNLNRLHLGVWHGINKHDYHSLPLNEVKRQIQSIAQQLTDSLGYGEEPPTQSR